MWCLVPWEKALLQVAPRKTNTPKHKNSADVNGEGQVSCLLQPTVSIYGNLNTQVSSEDPSENISQENMGLIPRF